MTVPALRIRGLVKRYRRGMLARRTGPPAVDHVDLTVGTGQVVALVGESGSGKTTLARCALALLRPDAGDVSVLGTEIHSLRGAALDRFRRRVQPLFQDPDAHLNPGLRVREILAETVHLHRAGEAPGPLLAHALDQVGLTHRAEALPHELSGGERRRVGIARLLICRPELVIADEPTAGLDAARKAEVMDLILDEHGGGRRTTLVISHDLPLMASCADRLVVMVAGRIVERMPAASLSEPPHHPYTAELLAAAGLLPGAAALPPSGQAAGAGAPGCPLAGRCALERPRCADRRPAEVEISPAHRIACHAATDSPIAGPPTVAGTSSGTSDRGAGPSLEPSR